MFSKIGWLDVKHCTSTKSCFNEWYSLSLVCTFSIHFKCSFLKKVLDNLWTWKEKKNFCLWFFSAPYILTTYVPTLNLKFKTWGRLDYTFPCFNKKNMKKSWFLHKIIFVCVSSGNWFDHISCIIFSLLNTCIIVFER